MNIRTSAGWKQRRASYLTDRATTYANLYWIALGIGDHDTAADCANITRNAIALLGHNPLPKGALPC